MLHGRMQPADESTEDPTTTFVGVAPQLSLLASTDEIAPGDNEKLLLLLDMARGERICLGDRPLPDLQ